MVFEAIFTIQPSLLEMLCARDYDHYLNSASLLYFIFLKLLDCILNYFVSGNVATPKSLDGFLLLDKFQY